MRAIAPLALSTLAALSLSMRASFALAQPAPGPIFENPDEMPAKPGEVPKPVPWRAEWKALVKAGLLYTSGNSQTLSFSGAGTVSRKQGNHKVAFDAGWTYAKANTLTAVDANGSGRIDPGEFFRQKQTTANAWYSKLRYDRIFLDRNSAYAQAQVGADFPAGKDLYAGLQLGYSRALWRTQTQELLGEIGYDYTFERYDETVTGGTLDHNHIHSLRFFLGYKLTLSQTANFFVNAEGIFNLNRETAPTADGTNSIAPFVDARFNGKTGLVFALWRNINFGISFSLKYDNRPAPLPVFNPLTPFADGFVPIAQRTDTLTEAQLIINFL